jgi:hypothetical protein
LALRTTALLYSGSTVRCAGTSCCCTSSSFSRCSHTPRPNRRNAYRRVSYCGRPSAHWRSGTCLRGSRVSVWHSHADPFGTFASALHCCSPRRLSPQRTVDRPTVHVRTFRSSCVRSARPAGSMAGRWHGSRCRAATVTAPRLAGANNNNNNGGAPRAEAAASGEAAAVPYASDFKFGPSQWRPRPPRLVQARSQAGAASQAGC